MTSLNIIFFIYIVINFIFLRQNGIPLYISTKLSLSILVEGHVGCVYFLAVVNRVAINVVNHVFVEYSHLLSNNSS